MKFEPNVLLLEEGRMAADAADWAKRRQEILQLLAHEEYGFLPKTPTAVTSQLEKKITKTCSGHAVLEKRRVYFETEKGMFSFPFNFFVPNNGKKNPLFVCINFRPDEYDMYIPVEEIIDRGYALAVLYYQDVTSDDGNMTDQLAGMYHRSEDGSGYGKISLWAFAMSRVIDCLIGREEIDPEHIAVIGHSRLGKTALWCGANDERVRYAISNDSGCAGASCERHATGKNETVKDITTVFPFWFCENYRRYAGKAEQMPFDQHFLLAASAPRYVMVGSASLDAWADPYGEQLSCIGASPAWKICGKTGYIGPEEAAAVGDHFAQGEIGYHLRDGIHFLGRGDWNAYMDFMEKYV